MQSRVQRWGNSLAVRIPKSFAVELGLEHEAAIEMTVMEGRLIVMPVKTPEYDLEELLARVTEENLQDAIETGQPVGKEAW